jgi:hypothetical protein
LHVHGRGARTDACGRSFAVLSKQASAVGLRLRLVVPRPIPAAVASRCCRRRFQQLACACHTISWRVAACLESAATPSQQEKNNSPVLQQSRVNIALSVQ